MHTLTERLQCRPPQFWQLKPGGGIRPGRSSSVQIPDMTGAYANQGPARKHAGPQVAAIKLSARERAGRTGADQSRKSRLQARFSIGERQRFLSKVNVSLTKGPALQCCSCACSRLQQSRRICQPLTHIGLIAAGLRTNAKAHTRKLL